MSSSAAPTPDQAPAGDAMRYRERLLPSPPVWLVALAVGIALWFVFSALHNIVGALIAVAGAAAVVAVLWVTSPVLQIGADDEGRWWLHAGAAQIELHYLGPAEPLDVEGFRQAMGPQLRADAYVCHRPWVRTGVRMPVTDAHDPTPYWLLATRTPERLAAALGGQPPSKGSPGREDPPGSADPPDTVTAPGT